MRIGAVAACSGGKQIRQPRTKARALNPGAFARVFECEARGEWPQTLGT
ncbi:MAG: hypothetical protein ACI8TX_000390 [Hyphomicrobiaceae bacterium]|jgi:hypothetical protein